MQHSVMRQLNGRPPPLGASMELVARLVVLLHLAGPLAALPSPSNSTPRPVAGECDFEKYLTGCYSQANFVCDLDTNHCKCLPETPVLIDQRLCIKRSKANEPCQYNEQCDNTNGYYCTSSQQSSATITQNNGSQHHIKGRCRNSADFYLSHLNSPTNNNNSNTSQQHLQHSQHQSQQPRHPSTSGTQFTSSILPRLLWLFLLACLIGLVVLLFLIRSQQYRIEWYLTPEVVSSARHHHHHYQDPSQLEATQPAALDVPPPYEVAIQMKS